MPLILVADDDDDMRALVLATLFGGAFEVTEASDGLEALDRARRYKPDVMLLDVVMPGMSGLEVCRALKADPDTQAIVVILLSGALVTAADRAAGFAAGADGYFLKPFSPAELIAAIEQAMHDRTR